MSGVAFLGLQLGALAPPLAEQLAERISTPEQREAIEHLQRDTDAISRLYVRGLISESVAIQARNRIVRAVAKALRS
jgi:hypothetical protein